MWVINHPIWYGRGDGDGLIWFCRPCSLVNRDQDLHQHTPTAGPRGCHTATEIVIVRDSRAQCGLVRAQVLYSAQSMREETIRCDYHPPPNPLLALSHNLRVYRGINSRSLSRRPRYPKFCRDRSNRHTQPAHRCGC